MKKVIFFLILFFTFSLSASANEALLIDVTNSNIIEIQSAIDKGLITYEMLVRQYINTIKEYNFKYNAVSYINEGAIESAKKIGFRVSN